MLPLTCSLLTHCGNRLPVHIASLYTSSQCTCKSSHCTYIFIVHIVSTLTSSHWTHRLTEDILSLILLLTAVQLYMSSHCTHHLIGKNAMPVTSVKSCFVCMQQNRLSGAVYVYTQPHHNSETGVTTSGSPCLGCSVTIQTASSATKLAGSSPAGRAKQKRDTRTINAVRSSIIARLWPIQFLGPQLKGLKECAKSLLLPAGVA